MKAFGRDVRSACGQHLTTSVFAPSLSGLFWQALAETVSFRRGDTNTPPVLIRRIPLLERPLPELKLLVLCHS